jgi:hypothetical protein
VTEVIVAIAGKFAWTEDIPAILQISNEALTVLHSPILESPFFGRARSKGVETQNVVNNFSYGPDQS